MNIRPTTPLEKKILNNKVFQEATQIGRPRPWHPEGTIKNHIIQLLRHIDRKYYSKEYYTELRIIALLHDVGKFAKVPQQPALFMPDCSRKKQQEFIRDAEQFRKKYDAPLHIKKKYKAYQYTRGHAYRSYAFARQFVKKKNILDIIRYHDLAHEFMSAEKHTGTYDAALFTQIFSRINIELYTAFLECEHTSRQSNMVSWFTLQLQKHKISNL